MAHTSPFQVTVSPVCMRKDVIHNIHNNTTSTTTITTTNINNNKNNSNIHMNTANSIVVTPAYLLTLLPGAIPPESISYFYGKITREQAEELLFTHGANEGLFLLRESVNRNYAVSICHLGRVHHYNVERQTDCSYRIQTGHKFIGPVELVKHHSTQLDGFLTLAQIPLNRPSGVSPLVLQGLNSDDLEQGLRVKAIEMGLKGQSVDEALSGPMRNHLRFLVVKDLHLLQPWYHHTIRRRDAELRLANEGNQEGTFLVRYRKEDGVYVLSLTSQNEPKHYRIEEHLGRWSIEGGQYFETLMELIDHYHFRQDGLLCKLQKPVSAPGYKRSRSGSGTAPKIVTDDFKISLNSDNKNQQIKPKNPLSTNINNNIWNESHSLPSLSTFPIPGINLSSNSKTSSTNTQSLINRNVNTTDNVTVITITSATTLTSVSTTITTSAITTTTTTTAQLANSSSTIRQDLISFNDWPNVTRLLSNQNSPNQPSTTTTQIASVEPINEQVFSLINRHPIPHTPFTPPSSIPNLQHPLNNVNNSNNNNDDNNNRNIISSRLTHTTIGTGIGLPNVTMNSCNFTNTMLIDSTCIPQMALFDRDINGFTRLMNTTMSNTANTTAINSSTSSNAFNNLTSNMKDTRVGCLKPIRLNEPLTSIGKAFAEVDNAIAHVNNFQTNLNKSNSNDNTHFIHTNNHTTIDNISSCNNNNDEFINKLSSNITDKRITSSREFLPTQTLHFPPILDTPWEEPDCSEDHALSTSSSGGSCGGGGGGGVGGGSSSSGCGNSGVTPTNRNISTFIGNNPFLPFISPTLTRRTSIVNNNSLLTNHKIHSTSSDIGIFCSGICCHHSIQGNISTTVNNNNNNNNNTLNTTSLQNSSICSRPIEIQSNRSAWANAISPENAQQIYDELPPSNFLLSSQTVTLKERLGGGNFGHVVKGLYRTPSGQEVPVAVKTLKPNQIVNTGEREILAEARTMAQLKHRHIVRLIGVCKEEQFMLVLELAPLGPINKYLKRRPDVSVHTLTELMHQVALGMAYLESCKFVHRDLAARNVLLVTRHFAKISDFGMSKALNFGSDYYRAATAGKWPLKWYAPECIYYFRFDSKSDVWSYGITLWEVYSYGERPYRDMKGAQILAMLDQGLRLSRPSRCPESIYSVMQQCWNFEGYTGQHLLNLFLQYHVFLKQCHRLKQLYAFLITITTLVLIVIIIIMVLVVTIFIVIMV
ncbi:unnamed protein product [Heterobilharzia americana]|nr:unnamed protein product [Heterobilharzia americana]